VRLIPWTLHSGSEHFIYNWKLEKGPGPGSKKLEAAQRNGQEETGTEIYISGPETPEIYFFVRYICIIMGLLCTVLCN
jgi:hypothetical protein